MAAVLFLLVPRNQAKPRDDVLAKPRHNAGAGQPDRYFTPCIKRWISGAIRKRNAPDPTSTQKPKV